MRQKRAAGGIPGRHAPRPVGPIQVPWQKLRDTIEVKLSAQEQEVYVLAKCEGRRQKETAIRRGKLARLPAPAPGAAP